MAGPFVQFGLVAADVQDLQRGERLPQQVFGVEVFLDLRSSGSKAKLFGAIAFEQQNTARPQRSRSEEHTSELQSLMRISYAVFCLKKKTNTHHNENNTNTKQ